MKKNKIKYKGFVDNNIGPVIRGWAINVDSNHPVTVKITTETDEYYTKAELFRKDLYEKSIHPTGNCGFQVNLSKILDEPAEIKIVEECYSLKKSTPFYGGKKFFFMHIAKTAGSTFNTFLNSQAGSENCREHIEGCKNWEDLRKYEILSGHISLSRFTRFFDTNEYVKFSFFRNPIDQLVSHLYWVRHLSEPGFEEFKQGHPLIVQKLSEKLTEIDLSNANHVKHFFENLDTIERPLFDNCQCRYLNPAPPNHKYNKDDFHRASERLLKIKIIGITEYFEETLHYINKVMGWQENFPVNKKENVSTFDYGFKKGDSSFIEAVMPAIEHDNALYERAKSLFKRQIIN